MRRLRGEASRSYLGNRSAAEIACHITPKRSRQICRERSGQKSAEAIVVGATSRSAHAHVKIAGSLTQRRAEPKGDVLTAGRTVNSPTTPAGEVEPRADPMGSMWAFRSRLRPDPYTGLSRV